MSCTPNCNNESLFGSLEYKKPATCGIFTHSHFTDWLQVAKATMHLVYLLFASFGLCMAESIIEEIPNYNRAMADRLAILEKKMLGLEEENKYLRLGLLTCFIDTYVANSVQNKVDEDL